MLKINKYVWSVCVAGSLFMESCTRKDVLELSPEYSLDALNNPSSMAQVEQVLTGAYAGLRNANYYGSGSGTGAGYALMPDILSDNLYETLGSLANSRTIADWTYNSNTAQITTLYSAPYAVIAGANIVLRDVDKFTTAANRQMANRIKGQAFALRALAHFDLFRYFGNKFDRNSTTDLALEYVRDFTVSQSLKPVRMNNKEYYDNLFADLTLAVTLLADVDKDVNPATALSRPNMDLAAAYALQARINLYAAQWADAVKAATSAIARRPLVVRDQAAFSGMYNQTNPGELIFNVQFESGQSGPTYLILFPATPRNYFRPALEVADSTGNAGLIRSNDIRYSAYFTKLNDNNSKGLGVTKYKGKNALTDGAANFPVLRTGEMYLIRAEANAMLGTANEVQALADLNTLRAARITGYTTQTLTGTALLGAIADERRRELFAEGHRFFDLKRTTRVITRGSTCGNTAVSPAGNCSLPSTAREWTLPIPESVRNANANVTQNGGY